MTSYQKFGFIAGQIFFGFLFGIAGCLVTGFIHYLFSIIYDFRLELFDSILYPIIGGYSGMLFGVAIVTYKLFNNYCKNKKYWRFIIQGIVGYGISLFILYYFLIYFVELFRNYGDSINFFSIAFPLIFLVMFSNFKIYSCIEKWSKEE